MVEVRVLASFFQSARRAYTGSPWIMKSLIETAAARRLSVLSPTGRMMLKVVMSSSKKGEWFAASHGGPTRKPLETFPAGV